MTTSLLRDRARRLRRDSTDAEQKFWRFLRGRGIRGAKFRRQHPIGPYITDFCCMEWGLVVELDGGQHTSRRDLDLKRTAFLEERGYRVIRFWDHEALNNTEAVLERIIEAVESPHPRPLPQGEGKNRAPSLPLLHGEGQ